MEMELQEYNKRIENEKKFYDSEKYNDKLVEKTSSGLEYVLSKFQERVKKNTGQNVWEHVATNVNEKIKNSSKPVRMLSIGSGPGGAEMMIAKNFVGEYLMDCLDINDESISIGQKKANALNLNLKFIQQDINKLSLSSEIYDVVFAHASLHHMLNHEHIAKEIKKAMKANGVYLIYDIIVRNGMLIWDETKPIISSIFSLLPKKYKLNQYAKMKMKMKEYLSSMPDLDVSKTGFECIRSEEVYPTLKQNFITKIEVPGFSFARRFVDHPFEYNYDVENNPFDKAVLDTIIELDEKFTESHKLKPESVFLVLEK